MLLPLHMSTNILIASVFALSCAFSLNLVSVRTAPPNLVNLFEVIFSIGVVFGVITIGIWKIRAEDTFGGAGSMRFSGQHA